MESVNNFDNPGDCQSKSITPKVGNENNSPLRARSAGRESPSSANVKAATAALDTGDGEGGKPASSAMPLATNKLKSQQPQQQQQQQQHQHHQFRAPQQFVKHKKASSSSSHTSTATATANASSLTSNNSNNKRNKCWNKRQNRTAKQNTGPTSTNRTTSANNKSGSNESAISYQPATPAHSDLSCGLVEDNHQQGSSKADVENIQNLKNQVGGHNYYHHYQQQHHHHSGGGGNGGASSAIGEARLSLPITSEKIGYGHGHLKSQQQQLHKKPMPTYRGAIGHNHHILCAGSAHNAMGATAGNSNSGGGGVGSAVSSSNMSCCHINGCGNHTGKDNQSGGGNISSANNASTTLHHCCLRSKFFLPDKRPRKGNFIPPTKFLLGGNISDPLNLSSLQNETSNISNTTPATTPRQSPITTPPKVEVIIPPNIHDPLHLLDPVDSMEYEKQLTSPMKRGGLLGIPAVGVGGGIILGLRGQIKSHKHRHRKNRKPKRKRYDSFNSTASSTIGDTLDDLTPSALINASTSTEKGTSMLSSSIDSETKSQPVDTEGCSSSGVVGDEDDLSERNLCSPQLSLSHSTDTKVETKSPTPHVPSITVDSSSSTGNATAGGTASIVSTTVGETRERACRDLRLDLVSTTTGSTSCGSSVVSSTGGGGRKRKISESNNSQKPKKYFRNDSMDKIVSPVVPQPGAWKRPPRTTASGARKTNNRRSTSMSESTNTDMSPVDDNAKVLVEEIPRDDTPDLIRVDSTSEIILLGSPLSTTSGATSIPAGEVEAMAEQTTESANTSNALISVDSIKKEIPSRAIVKPKFSDDGRQYRYGNYDRYAGLRHLNEFMDIRLQVFLQYPELFKNKDILDIGCNVGHMTISVARKLAPKSILGIDIDKDLVARARRNLSMYVRIPAEVWRKENTEMEDSKGSKDMGKKTGRRRRKKKKQQMEIQHANNSTSWHQFQHQQLMHYHHPHHHHHHHHYHHHHHHHRHLHKLQSAEIPNVDAADFFPISFPLTYGGITQSPAKPTSPQNLESQSPASTSTTTRSTPGHPAAGGSKMLTHNSSATTVKLLGCKAKNEFPQNVFFRQTNYVLKDENLLANDTQQYDLILCLSVTKWIHLNFGDAGLKSAFKRMFNQLRPGGKLILEAQNWASYKKKKNLTEDIYNNYNNIEFFPNKFHEYLLSSEVGFSHSYTLGVPKHLSKGFSRPIQLYAKGDYTPNHVRWSDAYYPQTPFEAYRGIYATMPPRPTGMHSSYPVISSSRSQNYDTPHYTGGGGASGPYSCRQTPMHQPSTSQYYNPLESDSYQPSYDMEYLNHMYVFASPLYQTVWSPPTSMRKSSSHTPVFGSVREAEFEGDGNNMPGGSYHRHVYPPNDETSSPNASAINAFNSIRDPDTDDSNQQRPHVYATNCESSSSPHPHNLNPNEADAALEENLMMDEESRNNCCDLGES